MTHLGREALEERAGALVLDELLDHGHTRDLVLEVGVLDARLDRVERRGDGDGRDGARDGGDEVLAPGRLVVVLDAEHVLFGRCGRAKELLGCASDEGASIGLGGYGKGEGGDGRAREEERETYRKATRCVSCHCPSPSTVERRTLLEEYPDDAATTERLRVDLPLDLERI